MLPTINSRTFVHILLILGLTLTGTWWTTDSWSQQPYSEGPVSVSRIGKVPIGGYDSVAYHNPEAVATHTASKGQKSWTFNWRGANWRFLSEQNYLAFKANPEKYRPAYGGFCSNALSLGEGLIKTNGTHWEIFDDQLHVFYAARGRDRWLDGNQQSYKIEADRAWKEITGFDD